MSGAGLQLLFLLTRSKLGWVILVLFFGFVWISGADIGQLLGGGQVSTGAGGAVGDAAEEELVEFVSFVLDDNQELWARLLPQMGQSYREAKLVLFRDLVRSACGLAQAATGPFYCPGDDNLYIDLGFYEELRRQFGAPGDFAQAYVIAHEIGHHVQNLLGIEQRVRGLQRERPSDANALSVRMELQADCLAGVWGHSAAQRGDLEPGDLEEGLNAAAAIGDDRIQRSSGQSVNPDAFTHGSSAQRVEWFRRGFDTGDPAACDTFAGAGVR
jgi:predicted metalloprotease